MKKRIIPIIIAVTTLALGACSRTDSDNQASQTAMAQNRESMAGMEKSMEMDASKAHTMVQVPTIICENCKNTIEEGLVKTAGILSVQVDLEAKIAHINYNGSVLEQKDVEQAIAKLGYQANDTPADPDAYEALSGCCKIAQ